MDVCEIVNTNQAVSLSIWIPQIKTVLHDTGGAIYIYILNHWHSYKRKQSLFECNRNSEIEEDWLKTSY